MLGGSFQFRKRERDRGIFYRGRELGWREEVEVEKLDKLFFEHQGQRKETWLGC